jgi:hypothetical protein
MARTFLKFLNLFVALLSISAEICRFSLNLHEEFFNFPEDSLEPKCLKKSKKDAADSFEKIRAFSIPDLSAEDCRKANSIIDSFGRAFADTMFPANIEMFERNRVILAVTEVAFRKMLNPSASFPEIMDSLPIVNDFCNYYYSVASMKNSFMFSYKSESDEIMKLIGKGEEAQFILNKIESCIIDDNLDDSKKESDIKSLLQLDDESEERANKVITLKNTLKQKCNQRFLTVGEITLHYVTVLEAAFDRYRGYTYDLAYYLIFKELIELNFDESFTLIFANHPEAAEFIDKAGLPSILKICKEYFFSQAKEPTSWDPEGQDKFFEDLENLNIPMVKQRICIFSKKPPDHDKDTSDLNPSNDSKEKITAQDITEDQTPDTITPPPMDKRLKILLFLLPVFFLIIGIVIVVFFRRKNQKGH